MSKPQSRLTDQVRRAIADSGLSQYAIAKASGVDKATLSRFLACKQGLTLTTLDALAGVLNLNLVAGGPVKPMPPANPPRRETGKGGRP